MYLKSSQSSDFLSIFSMQKIIFFQFIEYFIQNLYYKLTLVLAYPGQNLFKPAPDMKCIVQHDMAVFPGILRCVTFGNTGQTLRRYALFLNIYLELESELL